MEISEAIETLYKNRNLLIAYNDGAFNKDIEAIDLGISALKCIDDGCFILPKDKENKYGHRTL